MAVRTGIWRSAHSIRRTPSAASAMSFTSCRLVVAMNPSVWSRGSVVVGSSGSGSEQALLLALLPFDPRGAGIAGGEPGVDGAPQLGLAPQPSRESEIRELDAEAAPQLAQGAEAVQLPQAVLAIPGGGAPRGHEAGVLEGTQHPRRPTGLYGRGADGQRFAQHAPTLPQSCQCSARLPPMGAQKPLWKHRTRPVTPGCQLCADSVNRAATAAPGARPRTPARDRKVSSCDGVERRLSADATLAALAAAARLRASRCPLGRTRPRGGRRRRAAASRPRGSSCPR